MDKIRFLHIVKDDKFYQPVKDGFLRTQEIQSEYILYNESNKDLRFINDEDVNIYSNPQGFIERIQRVDYDVLYLHSLQPSFYRFIKYIPKNVIVVWWAWGYDIYGQQVLGLDSFINLDFFKPETTRIRSHIPLSRRLKKLYAKLFMDPIFSQGRKRIISRVDYFQPVCPIDYYLMKEKAGLKAKEIYLPMFGNFSTGKEIVRELNSDGSILIGNSAEYAQNHLDVWMDIKSYISEKQSLLVPLSYGNMYYARLVKNKMKDNLHSFIFLDTFLPQDQYFKLFDDCTYAVFGAIRQQAMGNVYNTILRGIKVFFYKDSYIYKYLQKIGCIVFSIEEANHYSFRTPLSAEDQQHNFDVLYKEQEECRKVGFMKLLEISEKAKVNRENRVNEIK